MAERFVTFWPSDARLVHIRDLVKPTVRYGDPGWSLCGAWQEHREGEEFTLSPGEHYLLCATCTKIRKRREKVS